jgi:hypothetical protein
MALKPPAAAPERVPFGKVTPTSKSRPAALAQPSTSPTAQARSRVSTPKSGAKPQREVGGRTQDENVEANGMVGAAIATGLKGKVNAHRACCTSVGERLRVLFMLVC